MGESSAERELQQKLARDSLFPKVCLFGHGGAGWVSICSEGPSLPCFAVIATDFPLGNRVLWK